MHANNVLRGQRGKPLPSYVAGWILLLTALPGVLFLALMIHEALSDPQGSGYGVLGVDLTSLQFLAVSPVVALLFASTAALGYGLVRGRPWSRPLGTGLWFGIGLVTGGMQIYAGLGVARAVWPVLWGLVCSAAAFWYFYGRRNVRAYRH
ncbi:MAG TPA: hypothetical protein VK929_06660 [Longimicrobiales bacterium]|nr:hypothetical protein [Longimicrobiales bacterium]